MQARGSPPPKPTALRVWSQGFHTLRLQRQPSQRPRPLPAPYLQSLTYVSPEAPGTSQILFFGYSYRLLEEGDRHYHLNGTHSWQHNAQVSTEERANTFQTVTTVILWDLRSNLPYKTHPR